MNRRSTNPRRIIQATLLVAMFCPLVTHAGSIAVPAEVKTIQEAIDLAQGDDIVLVSPGNYNEVIDFKGKAITLKSTDGASVTILDGWRLDDSIVKCISGEGPSTILDGFTLTGGTGNTDLYGKDATVGGGLLCLHSSPTILNCIFVSNETTYHGGAIFNGDRSNTSIQNCKIRANTSERGGGVYNNRGRPVIRDTVLSENVAKYGGGAMYNFGSNVRIISCSLKHNRAAYNGGGVYDYDSSGYVTDSVFTDNLAMFNGNAMYRGYRSATIVDEDCRFTMVHDTISGTGGFMVARGKQIGACCVGTGCLIVDEDSCVRVGGSWLGSNTTCEDQMLACPKPNTGDVNTDGVVDMMDLVLVMTSMQNTAKN
jgi:hypothetical protein